MKKLLGLISLIAIAAFITFAPMHQAKADYEPATQVIFPQVYTFTGASPSPQVVNTQGYKYCVWTAETGATFNSTTLTAKTSGDLGTTYTAQSGTTDPGATPAPVQTLTAVGKVRFDVTGMTNWEAVASGGGSSTSVVSALNCTK